MPTLRTLLTLGRVSNLPTVWSNALAGWWLGGGGHFDKLPLLFAGLTLLYIGGMFLNDAFDADFDRQFRSARPIPSGAISLPAVWRLGLVWLGAGAFCLIRTGPVTGGLALGLLICILAYDAIHKMVPTAPMLMGACRFLVYLIAAAAGEAGIDGTVVWCGLALAAYVVGLSYLARGESTGARPPYWPILLLAVPIPLALVMNTGVYREAGILLSLLLALWIVRSLRLAHWSKEPKVGGAVASLLAGIVLVDLLGAADVSREFVLVFVALLVSTWLLQRVVPAT